MLTVAKRALLLYTETNAGKEGHMEIERKFLITSLPSHLEQFEKKCIEQSYLCTDPVVRVRRAGEQYLLTCKGPGLLTREEINLPLTEESYRHLRSKADGAVIAKTRYLIPYAGRTIELDVFDPPFAPLVMAEVEFESAEQAGAFEPPAWFDREVTCDPAYTNAALSQKGAF